VCLLVILTAMILYADQLLGLFSWQHAAVGDSSAVCFDQVMYLRANQIMWSILEISRSESPTALPTKSLELAT
jgi:hypothetical protein